MNVNSFKNRPILRFFLYSLNDQQIFALDFWMNKWKKNPQKSIDILELVMVDES